MNNFDEQSDPQSREKKEREAEAKRRNARATEIGDIRWLMSSPRGRRILWRLLDLAGVNRQTFSTNAMQMAFNEGNRNLGTQLLDEVMELCPDRYLEMLKEKWNDNRDASGPQSN